MRIRRKSIVLLLLCTIIPLLQISVVSFITAQNALEAQAGAELAADTKAALDRIEAFFEKVTVDVAAWSSLPVIQDVLIDDEDGEIATELVRLQKQYGYFAGLLVLNDQGICVAATDDTNLRRNFSDRDLIQEIQRGRMFQGRVEDSNLASGEALVFAVPIHADYNANTIIGTFVGAIDWAHIEQILSEVFVSGMHQDREHVLTLRSSEDARILYQSAGAGAAGYHDGAPGFLIRAAQSEGRGGFSDPAWTLQAAVASDVVYARVDTLRLRSLLVGVVAFFLVLGVGFWGANRLSKPIVSITQTMEELAGGKVDVQVGALDRSDEIGEMARSLLVFKDNAVQRRKAEEDLRQAKEEAERANLAKSKFLAAASHDLRQPLHAQGLFIASLFTLIDGEESRRILGKMKQSVEALDDMFGALLDITGLESGASRPAPSDFRIGNLLQWIETDFAPAAEEKGIELRVVQCGAVVRSDPALLGRIVRNLVSNAIRYTESGRVLLGCRRRAQGLRIEVWDTGIGIPESSRRRIFEEFYRVQDFDSAGEKRLGLGLAIVERTARLLGHPIDVASTDGRGSMFAVEAPYGSSTEVIQPALSIPGSASGSIAGTIVLLIDDDLEILGAMGGMLESWGCEPVAAQSADGALARLDQLGRKPDLALVDYLLAGGETGLQAMARIEAALGYRLATIIVTGTTTPDVVAETRRSGYRILHKPVQPAKLRAICSHMLSHPENLPAGTAARERGPGGRSSAPRSS